MPQRIQKTEIDKTATLSFSWSRTTTSKLIYDLSKQLEKSSNFTELVAQMDRKWAESVARECSRVREETMIKVTEENRKQIKELTNDHEIQIARMRDECANLLGQLRFHAEKTKLDQVENKSETGPCK